VKKEAGDIWRKNTGASWENAREEAGDGRRKGENNKVKLSSHEGIQKGMECRGLRAPKNTRWCEG